MSAFWKIMGNLNRKMMLRVYGPKFPAARFVLLLTTTGRKSGLPRVTPLQYEEIDGLLFVASARGKQADWIMNLKANPRVSVQVRERRFSARAELICDPQRVADFLQLRYQKHPWMIGLLLRLEGLPLKIKRSDLERLAESKALVALHPIT